MRVRVLAQSAFLAVLTVAAFAHETWMMPSTFVANVGETVRLDLTSGMDFPRLESPIALPRVAKAAYQLRGHQFDITARTASETSLVLRQAFTEGGLATIWLDLKPKPIELSDDKVEEYLDEIDATPDIRVYWKAHKGRVPWKELYTKHAKTFVMVGDAPGDDSWSRDVGAVLEIVPATNPTSAAVGQEFTVELRTNSKPLAKLPIGLIVEGASGRAFQSTDAAGRATFHLTKGGRALLYVVRLRLAKDGVSWESDFCTLTFPIRG